MSCKDDDLETPWIGECEEEYYHYEVEDDSDIGYDEDAAYENWRDMQYEEEMDDWGRYD